MKNRLDWQQLLSDLSITTEKPIDQSLLYFAMLLDLYQSTTNSELKEELERNFIKMLKMVP